MNRTPSRPTSTVIARLDRAIHAMTDEHRQRQQSIRAPTDEHNHARSVRFLPHGMDRRLKADDDLVGRRYRT